MKAIITLVVLVSASTAFADGIGMVLRCPKQFYRVIDGNAYCQLGMAADVAIKERLAKDPANPILSIGPDDDPLVIDMRNGAPIALPAAEDAERQRAIDARNHGAHPYSGRGH